MSVTTIDCAQEPIHTPGTIQPHGLLLGCTLPDWSVAHVSGNVSKFLEGVAPVGLLGQSLDQVLPAETVHAVRNQLQTAMLSGLAERLDCLALDGGTRRYDLTVHLAGGLAVIEAVPSMPGAGANGVTLLRGLAGRLRRTATVSRLLTLAAQQMRAVTGYDRVMIYRFLHDDSGEVVAEAVRPGTDSYFGLRYPATDIPAQARALYRRQPLRLIPDVDYVPVPVLPGRGPDGQPLDLGLAALRSVSPVHIQYLRNMNVRATLTVSLMRGDKLWGLIACHHSEPHYLSGALCSAAELFGQMLSLQIDVREQEQEQHRLSKAQSAHDRLLSAMSPRDTVFEDLGRYADMLNAMIASDGLAVWSNGQLSGQGVLPPDEAIAELIAFLGQKPVDRIYATSSLAEHFAPAARFADRASGVLAIPISRAAQDYLLFFRREVIQTVTWGGNPDKAMQRDTSTGQLHPRHSFEVWRETVRCHAQPWTSSELRVAETLRVALLEVVLRRSELIASERQRAQDSQSLLIAELNHRIKNVLSLVLATTRQSAQQATSVEAFTEEMEHRIQALASAHDQINAPSGTCTQLRALLESEARAWNGRDELDERIQLSGSAVLLDVRSYQTLALVFHEMMTNAAKYGALSVPEGQLTVSWQLIEGRGLVIEWNESGGPEVQPPTRRGFGSIVTERTIPFELQGEARVEFRPEGLFACFQVPPAHVSAGVDREQPRDTVKPPNASSLAGLRLLLVEDSMMIALDAQAMLEDVGVQVEIAGSLDHARRALRLDRFDLAVLDVNLAGETSLGIAAELEARQHPFLFATGYGARTAIPERFDQVPVVTKPYNLNALAYAIGQVPGIALPG
ncbi:HWE histidine kinase domain-containing protein [Stutzerimonas azotifigens]|uniref:histidine kinase n=1 Tax=Stutzerimonas azotifigens TaxID=291995 RepID=A0ABR5YYD7_9GAMM|nr:HWE histidine kinase domain-containing protein [Stutzerimonas azotifigens]MBA1272967.1 GAF domain-containing protein [Stutzerimonas azotifigens]